MNIIHITDLEAKELDIFSKLSESELVHIYEPIKEGLFIAESPNVIHRALDASYEAVSFLLDEKEVETSAKTVLERVPDVPIYVASKEVLKNITGFQLTRGVLAAMRRKVLKNPKELIQDMSRICVLEAVMNPTNVGAIFRSAAALHMDAVLLSKGSSDPLYRRAARVSMGTVFQIPWTYVSEDYMALLKEAQFKTVAMALTDDSISLDDPVLQTEEKLAIIMGTEGDGLRKETIKGCDYTVKIPMSHNVDSLNVAAASAVAFWELRKRN